MKREDKNSGKIERVSHGVNEIITEQFSSYITLKKIVIAGEKEMS